jgi:hypothetical protein
VAPASATSKPTSYGDPPDVVVNLLDDDETDCPNCLGLDVPGDAHNEDT